MFSVGRNQHDSRHLVRVGWEVQIQDGVELDRDSVKEASKVGFHEVAFDIFGQGIQILLDDHYRLIGITQLPSLASDPRVRRYSVGEVELLM